MKAITHLRHISLGILGLLLIGVLVQFYKQEFQPQPADIIGVDVGACENVDTDPQTGLKMVYCCLDEIYQFQEEGLNEELNLFLDVLESTQSMSTASGVQIFESAYESTLHAKYNWTSFCGARVPCEICTFGPQCGNAVLQTGEVCDDGNMANGDGCSNMCVPEESSSSSSAVALPSPSDDPVASSSSASSQQSDEDDPFVELILEIEEQGTIGGEEEEMAMASSSSVAIESADSSSSVSQSSSTENQEPAIEEVPDSSSSSSQQATSSSAQAVASSAPSVAVQTQIVTKAYGRCGNGILEAGEECDDRNTVETDGCSRVCTIEIDHRGVWKGMPGNVRMGDGIRGANEQCDDGNLLSGDGCSATGRIESSMVTGSQLCGNSALDAGEECDDGNLIENDTCSATCFLLRGRIGDGVVQRLTGEQCDPLHHDSALPYGCDENGRFVLLDCGNGSLDQGEECDQGSENSNAPDAFCRPNCTRGRCGDNIFDSGEQCDDGNLFVGDRCDRLCQIGPGFSPLYSATYYGYQPAAPSVPTPHYPTVETVPVQQNNPPPQQEGTVSETGPAMLIILCIGAGLGLAWTRRRVRV